MKGSATSLAAAGAFPVAAAIRSSWPKTESVIMTGCRPFELGRALWPETWMHDRAVACQRGCFDDLVVPIDRQRFALFVDQQLEEGKNVLGVEARRGCGEPTRDVAIADDLHAILSVTASALTPSTLPPRSTARSTTTEPGRIEATISLLTRRGAGRPGMSAVVITMSCFLMCSATSAACLA